MASDNNLRLAFSVDTGKFPGLDDQELFDVRQFSIHEEMNGLFEVNVVAVVEEPNIPLAAFVGRAGALRIQTPNPKSAHPVRVWAGVCAHMSHLHAADPGLSAYHFCIMPVLWRTTLRTNSRIYQHQSTPDIVKALLEEWKITATWNLTATYKAHEYCVQYGETDFAFISRLLEVAGISFYFDFKANSGKGNDIVNLVFDDTPNVARKANTRDGALNYAGHQTPAFGALPDFCTTVSITQRVRTGKVAFRDFDFRLPPTLNLSGQAILKDNPESVYEHYEYAPGEFLFEPGKAGEGNKALADKYSNGKLARSIADDEKGQVAAGALEAMRRRQVVVGFNTNAIDLRPGLILGINQQATGTGATANHPRADLSPDQKLVITSTHLEGETTGEWSMTATAAYANFPLRPELKTPAPKIYGVQSAIVVGPKGSEIYTDEFGRVRVQFHWDREGKYDDHSSCWLRVSQAWAGGGFGVMTVPRVGHEVLVQFFEGDPNLPVIVGRVHNLSSPVPYPLPASQTISGIKTNSTPGGTGFNEIRFDDQKGGELIHVQAQQTLSTVVKGSESRDVGGGRTTNIGGAENLSVVGGRTTLIGTKDVINVQQEHAVSVGQTTGSVFVDKHVLFSTGQASIEIIGDSIFLNAVGGVHVHAGKAIEVTSSGGTIVIQGGPMVRINDASSGPPAAAKTVSPAQNPKGPAGGPNGTPPTLPTGSGTIPKPGPLSGDVNVQLPSNAVEHPSTANPAAGAAAAVGKAAAGDAGPLGALKTAVTSTLQSTGKSLLTTAMTDIAKGDFKDLSGKALEKTALGDLKTDASKQIGSVVTAASKSLGLPDSVSKALTTAAPNLITGGLKKFETSAVLAEATNLLPSIAGSGAAKDAAAAALTKVTGGSVLQQATQALSIDALGSIANKGLSLVTGSPSTPVAALKSATPTPDGKGAVTVTKADPTSPTGTTDTTHTQSSFNQTYDTVTMPTVTSSGEGG